MARHDPSPPPSTNQPTTWTEQIIRGLLATNGDGRSLFELRFLNPLGMSSSSPVQLVRDTAGSADRPDIFAAQWIGDPGRSQIRVHLVAVSSGVVTHADLWRLMAGDFYFIEWIAHMPKVRRAVRRLGYEAVLHVIGGSADNISRPDYLGFLQEKCTLLNYVVALDPFHGLVIRERYSGVALGKRVSDPLTRLAAQLRQQVKVSAANELVTT